MADEVEPRPEDYTDEEFAQIEETVAAERRRRDLLADPYTHACIVDGVQVQGSKIVKGYLCVKCGGHEFVRLTEAR